MKHRVTNDQVIKAWTEATDYVVSKFTDEGDFYRQHVLNKALFDLLGTVKGKKILDSGCGEGYLSRMLSKKGAIVTGLEPAHGLIQHAIETEKKENLGIEYIEKDLSEWEGKKSTFDIVVSNMVFMDIPDWKPAMRNCINTLKPKGVFVFSISHPCFDIPGKWESEKPHVKVTNYFNEYTIQNYIGPSFHRMLSSYVNFLSENGCYITQMLEPSVPEKAIEKKNLRDRNIPNFLLIKAVKM